MVLASCVGIKKSVANRHMCRAGQNRIYAPYMTVCLVTFLPKYHIYTTYICMVLADPMHVLCVLTAP